MGPREHMNVVRGMRCIRCIGSQLIRSETRFRNKLLPFQLPQLTAQCNLATAATKSLSNFLLSALPAFTRFLSDIKEDDPTGVRYTLGDRI